MKEVKSVVIAAQHALSREKMSRLKIELHGLRMLNSEFINVDPVAEAENEIKR